MKSIVLGISTFFLLLSLPSPTFAYPNPGDYDALPGGTVDGVTFVGPGTLTVDEGAGTGTFTSPNFVEEILDLGPPLGIIEVPVLLTGTFTDPSTLELIGVCIEVGFPGDYAVPIWQLNFSDDNNFELTGTVQHYSDNSCATATGAPTLNTSSFMQLPAPPGVPSLGEICIALLVSLMGLAGVRKLRVDALIP